MGLFGNLTGALGNSLPGFMSNPFGSPQFGLEQQMGTHQAQGLGGQGMSNLLRNMTASGMSGGASSPAGLEMQQNQGRANTGMQAQLGFMNPTMNALNRQQFAMGLGSQYRPQQTGQTSTQSTGGMGSWLPQLASMGMGLATGGMGGMMGAGGGGGMGGFTPPGFNGGWGGSAGFQGGMSGAAPGAGSLFNPFAGPPPPMGSTQFGGG